MHGSSGLIFDRCAILPGALRCQKLKKCIKHRPNILRHKHNYLAVCTYCAPMMLDRDGRRATYLCRKSHFHSILNLVSKFWIEVQPDHIRECKKMYSWYQWPFLNTASCLAMVDRSFRKVELRLHTTVNQKCYLYSSTRHGFSSTSHSHGQITFSIRTIFITEKYSSTSIPFQFFVFNKHFFLNINFQQTRDPADGHF